MFNQETFFALFLFALLWNIVGIAWMLWRRKKRGLQMPRVNDPEVVYFEKFASGSSFKSWITRLGGASNCLTVMVTRDEVCVTSFFPFTAFLGFCDLEHRIPFKQILAVSQIGRGVELEFRRPDASSGKIRLYLRKSAEFLEVVRRQANAE